MSGGSLDYIQYKIDDAAGTILTRAWGRTDAVLLRAFAKHLLAIGLLCHKIEWDFSGDASLNEADYEAIKKIMGGGTLLDQAVLEAREAHTNLGKLLDGGKE
jgi:hypothetical protein